MEVSRARGAWEKSCPYLILFTLSPYFSPFSHSHSHLSPFSISPSEPRSDVSDEWLLPRAVAATGTRCSRGASPRRGSGHGFLRRPTRLPSSPILSCEVEEEARGQIRWTARGRRGCCSRLCMCSLTSTCPSTRHTSCRMGGGSPTSSWLVDVHPAFTIHPAFILFNPIAGVTATCTVLQQQIEVECSAYHPSENPSCHR